MKAASGGLETFLEGGREFELADLYTFTLKNGSVLRYSNTDYDIKLGGNTFSAKGPRFNRTRVTQTLSLDTVKMDVTVAYDDTAILSGLSLAQLLLRGDFRKAAVRLERAFMASPGDTSFGTLLWFVGTVGEIDPIGLTQAKLAVRSGTEILDMQLPRNVLQPECQWNVFDTGCALNSAAYVVHCVAGVACTALTLNAAALVAADGYFDLGKIVVTSGAASGWSHSIRSYAGGIITLVNPTVAALAPGDTFDAYPGCDNLMTTCSGKYANLANFVGMPFIPQPESVR